MPRLTADFPGSTMLSGASYDPDSETLDLTFTGGRTYTYESVPQRVFEDLRDAPSPGSFYWSNIKDRY